MFCFIKFWILLTPLFVNKMSFCYDGFNRCVILAVGWRLETVSAILES